MICKLFSYATTPLLLYFCVSFQSYSKVIAETTLSGLYKNNVQWWWFAVVFHVLNVTCTSHILCSTAMYTCILYFGSWLLSLITCVLFCRIIDVTDRDIAGRRLLLFHHGQKWSGFEKFTIIVNREVLYNSVRQLNK